MKYLRKLPLKKLALSLVATAFILTPTASAYALSAKANQAKAMYIQSNAITSTSDIIKSSSNNWSGYGATGKNKAFSSVSASWVQPNTTCAHGQTSYSAFWVGLDGLNDSTVEQVGSEADCINGTPLNYTWDELYPQDPSEVQTNVPVSAGNNISASVTFNPSKGSSSGASYTFTLTNNSTGATFSTTAVATSTVDRSSAEVITEALNDNGSYPLTDFGTVNFSDAKINGLALGKASKLQEITMTDPNGMLATPSALSAKKDFSITWSDPSS